MVDETQSYIDQIQTPALVSLDQAKSGIHEFAACGAARIGAQVELWMQALQAVEIAEPNEEIRGLVLQVAQKYGAIGREARAAQQHLRNLTAAIRELEELEGRLLSAADSAGYTVQGIGTPTSPQSL